MNSGSALADRWNRYIDNCRYFSKIDGMIMVTRHEFHTFCSQNIDYQLIVGSAINAENDNAPTQA